MESDNGYEGDVPKTIGPVKIEWDWDFDNVWHEMKSIGLGGSEVHVRRGGSLQAERAMQAMLGRSDRQTR